MQYFVLPIALWILCELLGEVALNIYIYISDKNVDKHKLLFSSAVGFCVLLGIYYAICFPLVIFKASFKIVTLLSLIYFAAILLYIIKNRKFIKIFNQRTVRWLFFLLLLVVIQLYFSSRNTIGSLRFYDTINYTNLVSGNIYGDGLNTIDFMNGYPGSQNGYAYQAYYILASFLYYLMNGICGIFGMEFFYYTQHTWMYSVILYFFIAEVFVNFTARFELHKRKLPFLLSFFFLFVFMSNFYWNSEQAYLGNSFRMIMVSYALYHLDCYFRWNNRYNLSIVSLICLALAACANSNSTLVLILLFGAWIFMEGTEKEYRMLVATLYFPVVNIGIHMLNGKIFNYFFVLFTILSICLWIWAKYFSLFSKKINLKKVLLILVPSFLIISSFLITKNIFDFNAFLNNYSGWNDMTWDYTDFSNFWRFIANLIYFALMSSFFFCYRKRKIVQMVFLIGVIFFNPFSAPVQNRFMPVYYRNYDIVINYYSLFMGIVAIKDYFMKRNVQKTFVLAVVIASCFVAYKQFLYHPHTSFEKYEGYDEILRMTRDEADTLLALKDIYINSDKDWMKVISSIYQTRTEIPRIHTLYSRNNTTQSNASESDKELYKIFYRTDYENDPYAPENPKFDMMCQYLEESEIDIVVQDKRVNYYDAKQDVWYSLTYVIDRCGNYPVYENETFAIYDYSSIQ